MNFYTLAAAYLAALLVVTQLPPENLKNWPRSCQRLHAENNKCENGLKSCNQHRIDYWRKRCEKDEPHGQ